MWIRNWLLNKEDKIFHIVNRYYMKILTFLVFSAVKEKHNEFKVLRLREEKKTIKKWTYFS